MGGGSRRRTEATSGLARSDHPWLVRMGRTQIFPSVLTYAHSRDHETKEPNPEANPKRRAAKGYRTRPLLPAHHVSMRNLTPTNRERLTEALQLSRGACISAGSAKHK